MTPRTGTSSMATLGRGSTVHAHGAAAGASVHVAITQVWRDVGRAAGRGGMRLRRMLRVVEGKVPNL